MPKITKRKGRDPASAFRDGIPTIEAPGAAADNLRNFSTIADAFFNILKDLNRTGGSNVQYKTMTKTAFKDLQAIVGLFETVEFKNRVEMRDYLKNKLKDYFQANHPPFPEIPADLENKAEIEAAFLNLHNQFYRDNGAGGFEEIHVARAGNAANFTDISRAIARMGKAIIDACDDTLRLEDPVELQFQFETPNDDPPAQKLYSFNRMDKERTKSPNDLLFADPSRYRIPLKEVDINDVTDHVGSKLQSKSNNSSIETSKDDSGEFGLKDDEDSIHFNNIANSALVFDGRLVFDTVTPGLLQVGRISHHDNNPQLAFTLKQDDTTGAIVLTANQKIVSARDGVLYRSSTGEDDSQIPDDVANKTVVKKGLSLTAKSLIGSKIDHRFVTISIPGNDAPNAAGIKAIIDGALLALPQIIPMFKPDLVAHLDANVDAAGMRDYYELIKQIQAAAAPKTVEAMKTAYNIYAESDYVSALGSEHAAKIRRYDA